MATISLWNSIDKTNYQTLSMIAIATQMAVEHNLRILMIDATFNDDTLEKSFWKMNPKTKSIMAQTGKLDIGSGAEGLISAVASNKCTPEIVPSYTRVVLKNRLDILCGLKTKIPEEYDRSMMLYKDLINTASKYYDMVFVDLPKSLNKDYTKAILQNSHIILYDMPQNLNNIDEYNKIKDTNPLLQGNKVIPLLSNVDQASKYNERNVARYIQERRGIAYVVHNTQFMEACCEAGVVNYFLKTRSLRNNINDKSYPFAQAVDTSCKLIINKIKELHLA
jgi:hypothetical protein